MVSTEMCKINSRSLFVVKNLLFLEKQNSNQKYRVGKSKFVKFPSWMRQNELFLNPSGPCKCLPRDAYDTWKFPFQYLYIFWGFHALILQLNHFYPTLSPSKLYCAPHLPLKSTQALLSPLSVASTVSLFGTAYSELRTLSGTSFL